MGYVLRADNEKSFVILRKCPLEGHGSFQVFIFSNGETLCNKYGWKPKSPTVKASQLIAEALHELYISQLNGENNLFSIREGEFEVCEFSDFTLWKTIVELSGIEYEEFQFCLPIAKALEQNDRSCLSVDLIRSLDVFLEDVTGGDSYMYIWKFGEEVVQGLCYATGKEHQVKMAVMMSMSPGEYSKNGTSNEFFIFNEVMGTI